MKLIYRGSGERLDIYLSENTDLSRSEIKRRIDAGYITVGGKKTKPARLLLEGEEISIFEPPVSERQQVTPKIIFEDENIIAVDKPAGVVTYNTPGSNAPDLVSALKVKIEKGTERNGVVHRLDKDTSGVLLFAKNQKASEGLKEKFLKREIEKRYIALVHGKIIPEVGEIEIPISRAGVRMSPGFSGRYAKSKYRVVEYLTNLSLLEVQIITGRTHQIRVHFAAIGHPVVGDRKYGKEEKPGRQFLHASKIKFELFGKPYEISSSLPADLNEYLKELKK